MRLKSITVDGFRAFGTQASFDLDADVILLHGPNGTGKTSLLDAILWAIAGRIDRIEDRGSPLSLYAREPLARVALTLAGADGPIEVIRASDGDKTLVRLRDGALELEGPAAEQRLCTTLLPHLKDHNEALGALSSVITRGVYLQQDLVRQFVESDTAADRFALVSEVIGAGVVLELQQSLEKSRAQWARSTSSARRNELEPMASRLAQVDEQLARLSEGGSSASAGAHVASEDLHRRAVALLGQSRIASDEVPTTPTRLNQFLKTLSAERARLERDVTVAATLAVQLAELSARSPADAVQLETLVHSEAALNNDLLAADQAIKEELAQRAADRERQIAAADRASRAATLASLALEDLGERCPVCEQRHDIEQTTRHLHELLEVAKAAIPEVAALSSRLDELNMRRAELQERLEGARSARRDLANSERERQTQRALLETRLADFGIDLDAGFAEQLAERQAQGETTLRQISALIAEAEQLSLAILRLGEQLRRDDLVHERATLAARVASLQARLDGQERTHELAGSMIEELRGASLEVTRGQIDQIAPIFQRIYSRIDPHPTFRVTQLIANMARGKGQLAVGVADPNARNPGLQDAGVLLSSSQLNSYAVSLFLAMNLALPALKLDITILDDPLQSLDALHLLGLVDVLRRFRANRQILVSTHDDRLLGLLQRKLRPVRPGERLITIKFSDWSREGPVVSVQRTPYDPDEPRVLAA